MKDSFIMQHSKNNFVATTELMYLSKSRERCKIDSGKKSSCLMDIYVQYGIKDGKRVKFVVKHDFLKNEWLDKVYLEEYMERLYA